MPKVGFINSIGVDIGDNLVPKDYLIERYPELLDTFKQAGLWIWGSNITGQLGGIPGDRSSPVQTISAGNNWKQVSAGSGHSSGIKTDGTLWMWGHNNSGQLGTNDTTHRSSPIQTVSAGTNWKQVVCSKKGFDDYTSAIKTDGTLWLWGYNGNGQLGDNTITHRSSPVQTVSGGTNWKQVSPGGYHAAAIKTDGTLWLWGLNSLGQLGDNTSTSKSSPVQTISAGTNWKQVSCGTSHTAAIKTDGTLWLWGDNVYGQLGQFLSSDRSSPVQIFGGGTNWKQISCGTVHTVAIKTDATLWSWGSNTFGELGDNTRTHRSSPVQTISGGTNWKQVSAADVATHAIKNDGTLWGWGFGAYGRMGNNQVNYYSSPVQTISGGTNWKQVSAGYAHTGAIRDDSSDPI